MGGVKSKVIRPFRKFNVHERAFKVFEKQKTVANAAPKHHTTEKLLEQHSRENPQIMDQVKMKDETLIARMNQLTIDTEGSMPQIQHSTRPLPECRKDVDEPELYFEEPAKIPVGKASLSQAEKFIMQHFQAPKEYSAKVIAEEHSVDRRQVQQVLKYFQTMGMHIPEEMIKKHPQFLDAVGDKKSVSKVKLIERIKSLTTGSKAVNEDKTNDEKDLERIKIR